MRSQGILQLTLIKGAVLEQNSQLIVVHGRSHHSIGLKQKVTNLVKESVIDNKELNKDVHELVEEDLELPENK